MIVAPTEPPVATVAKVVEADSEKSGGATVKFRVKLTVWLELAPCTVMG